MNRIGFLLRGECIETPVPLRLPVHRPGGGDLFHHGSPAQTPRCGGGLSPHADHAGAVPGGGDLSAPCGGVDPAAEGDSPDQAGRGDLCSDRAFLRAVVHGPLSVLAFLRRSIQL